MTKSTFDIPELIFPKIIWMRKHCVSVALADEIFYCKSPNRPRKIGTGKTSEEAIIDWCINTGVRHWSLK